MQIIAYALHQLGARAAQQACELVFAQGIGHGRDRAQNGGRVTAQDHRHWIRLTGVGLFVRQKIQSAATVSEPAHDDFVFAYDLLAVNAQVLTLFVRATGNG